MATKRRRPGDFSYGILNDIRDTITKDKADNRTGGLTALNALSRDQHSPRVLQGTGPYRAIVLRIDQKKDGSSKATNPDDASFPAYGVFSPSSTEKDSIPVVALRARIPELDSHLPIPDKYGDEGSGPHQAKINMHTLFIAQDDLVETPEPGSVIWVDFGGGPFNRTDPVYLGPVLRTQYAGQAGTIAAGAAGAPRSAFGAGCVGSMTSRAGVAGAGSTSSPLIVNSQSPGPRGALTQPARGGGSVMEGSDADPCIVANLKQNLNSAGLPIDAWVGRLSGNGGREVIVFVPGTTDLSKKFELIYWMHGANSYYTNNHSRRLPKEISNMAKQGRNFVLAHPALPWGGVSSKNRPCSPCKGCMSQQMRSASPKCAQPGAGSIAFSENGQCGDFPRMHTELLTILQNTYKATNLTPFVTIAVHSRGGFSVSSAKNSSPPGPGFARQLVRMPNGGPDRIVLADADYGYKSTQSIWDQYLSKTNKKVEFNILVSHGNVKSRPKPGKPSYPNNSHQAKKLFNALGHDAPDDFRSWFGKHQVPLEKCAGHTIVYIGGERGGPYNSHGDVGYACISYEHSGGTTVKNNGNPTVETTPRDGLPVPTIEGPPSPTQVEASKKEDFDCADLQKRLAASEQGLKITEERIEKYIKEIQALESVDIRATGQTSRQKHNEKLEQARDRLKASQENLPIIKQTVEKLKKEAESHRFHPNCRKLEKNKPQAIIEPPIVVVPSTQIVMPSSGCGGTVGTIGASSGPPRSAPQISAPVPDMSEYFHGPERCNNPDPRDTRKGWACPAGAAAHSQGVVNTRHDRDWKNPNTHWNFHYKTPPPGDWDIVNFAPAVLASKPPEFGGGGNGMVVQNKKALRALDLVASRAAAYGHPPVIITNEVLPRRNGAYRDPVWNVKSKGAKGSRHMMGDGWDIVAVIYKSRADELSLPLWTRNMRINLCKNLWDAGFRNFGFGKTNIHADTAHRGNYPASWSYNKCPKIPFKEFNGSSGRLPPPPAPVVESKEAAEDRSAAQREAKARAREKSMGEV